MVTADLDANEVLRKYRGGGTDFTGVVITGRLAGTYFTRCNFSNARFIDCDLVGIMFHDCNLRSAHFNRVSVQQTTVRHSDCSLVELDDSAILGCHIEDCELENSHWKNVTVDGSELILGNFKHAVLSKLVLYASRLHHCNFDLARVSDLMFIRTGFGEIARASKLDVQGLSSVDWQSVCLSLSSHGVPEFLARSGMPDVFVEYMLDCAESLDPAKLFSLMRSTFISYGSPDSEFARRLQIALNENGVRTFFFETDSVPGERLHRFMYRGISMADRTLLICSEASLDRRGVLNELEEVFSREADEGGTSLLIPITIDDYVFSWRPDRLDLATRLRSRVVADFRGAVTDAAMFHRALQQLLRGLRSDR